MKELLLIAVGSAFVNNVVLSQFLGICPFLGVSKNVKTAGGMGGAVIFVITIASFVTGLIYKFILIPTHFEYLQTIVFILVIAALSELWDIKNNPGNIPDAASIEEAKSHVDYRKVKVEGNTVTLEDPKAAIDLGGIAKGFIADKLKAYLKSEGIEHGQIDLGGNLLTIGSKTDGSDFHIGIQKPFAKTNEAITTVDIHDQSVVSSGTYERYFKKDGKIYHHLLDPKTGYPFDNGLLQVTIISNQSVDGDGLSTTCFALGLEEGTKLIESLDNIQAIFVTEDYSLHYAD